MYQYKIEVSSNNTNWAMVVNQTNNLTSTNANLDYCSATGRFVRITVTGLQPGFWASFFEFEVHGSADGSGPGGANTGGNPPH